MPIGYIPISYHAIAGLGPALYTSPNTTALIRSLCLLNEGFTQGGIGQDLQDMRFIHLRSTM